MREDTRLVGLLKRIHDSHHLSLSEFLSETCTNIKYSFSIILSHALAALIPTTTVIWHVLTLTFTGVSRVLVSSPKESLPEVIASRAN